MSCVFRETFFDNVSNENSYFSCFDLQVCEKIATFNEGSPIIFLSQGNSTSCVFRIIFFNNFCKEGLCVSCSDLQAREKIAPFSIYQNELSHHLLRHGDPRSCVFTNTFIDNVCNKSSSISCPDLQVHEKIE